MSPIIGIIASSRRKASYQSTVLGDNPVGFWMLNETSGTTATDLGTGANNLTYTNTPDLNQSTGLTGLPKGVKFKRPDNEVAPSLQVATFNTAPSGTWSSEAWFSTTDTEVGAVTAIRGFGNVETIICAFFMNISTGKVSAYITNSGNSGYIVLTSTTSVNTGAYFHVVCTATSGGAAKLYINGVEEASSSASRSTTSESRKFVVAAQPGSGSYQNYLSETAMAPAYYTSALTSTQITTHYNAGV